MDVGVKNQMFRLCVITLPNCRVEVGREKRVISQHKKMPRPVDKHWNSNLEIRHARRVFSIMHASPKGKFRRHFAVFSVQKSEIYCIFLIFMKATRALLTTKQCRMETHHERIEDIESYVTNYVKYLLEYRWKNLRFS